MSGIQRISVSAAQSPATVGAQGRQSFQPFARLDLTEAQRTQIRSIFKSAKQDGMSQADLRSQVNGSLTPAQQKTLATGKAGAGQRRHHHRDLEQTSQTSRVSDSSARKSSAPSPSSTILDATTNSQSRASVAQSTLVVNLQKQVLAFNGETPVA